MSTSSAANNILFKVTVPATSMDSYAELNTINHS